MDEIWKFSYLSENYEVSNLGYIRKTRTKRLLNPSTTTIGNYKQVALYINNKPKLIRFHKVIMMTFKPELYFEDAQINHIDGNKHNNNLENLEWCTQEYNRNHAIKNGLIKKGSLHSNSILKEHQIPVIRELYKILKNQKLLGRLFKVDHTTISKIITGKYWLHC